MTSEKKFCGFCGCNKHFYLSICQPESINERPLRAEALADSTGQQELYSPKRARQR